MAATFLRHGDIAITFNEDKSVQIVRESNGSAIVLSITEVQHFGRVLEVFNYPVTPPVDPHPRID